MKTIIFTLCLFLSGSLAAQSYSKLIQIADQFYEEGDYSASAAAYQRAFGAGDAGAGDLYNAACSHALAGQHPKALQYLDRAVTEGWSNLSWTLRDEDLADLHNLPGWEAVIQRMQRLQAEREKNYNQELIAELKEIEELDQKYRTELMRLSREAGDRSEEMRALWEKQMVADSVCLERVEAIIAKHGYPGRKLVGRQYDVAFLVIQHAPHEVQEKYLPLLTEAAEAGELDMSSLALLIDRVRMGNEEPQLYGSQLQMNQETGQWELYELADPEAVDARRSEMGLEPLADYLSRFGIEYSGNEE